jgi:putative ABC transport system ATP-binding protein
MVQSHDVQTGKLVLDSLAHINQGLGTITVVITHNAGIVAMADRGITMGSGKITHVTRNEIKVDPGELEW